MGNLKKNNKIKSNDILDKINDYNNKKNIEINKKLNIKKNYNINFDDTDTDLLILNDNNKKVLSARYNFFGIYQPETQLWIWASSIPGIGKKQIKIINDIKSTSYLFENSDNEDILFIYQLLTNDVLQLSDNKYFDLINKTLNYLSNGIVILNPVNKSNNTQFIGLTKIAEQYN